MLSTGVGTEHSDPLMTQLYILSPYRAVNSLRLGYKNQSFIAV